MKNPNVATLSVPTNRVVNYINKVVVHAKKGKAAEMLELVKDAQCKGVISGTDVFRILGGGLLAESFFSTPSNYSLENLAATPSKPDFPIRNHSGRNEVLPHHLKQ